ncbi:hypothetical protein EWT47_23020 [Escherichia coli O25b:H4]|nr:hypothetical protein [Escherichia coli]RXA44869.1 hypothetical protein EQ822_07050 [Escherichia coli]TFL65937.1 hypothetical protein ELY50_15280 [Escherichia coli]TFO34813.1 hypothetical protein ELX60_13135 [Escherichia coli]TLI16708.1 hypothetical protein EWT47_23020 [Escherichia coli O25b:H4]
MNNPLFTLHRIFTRYHTEIKREKRKVNSVNNQIKKNFFLPVRFSVQGINPLHESHRQNAGGEESNVHPSPIIHHLSL